MPSPNGAVNRRSRKHEIHAGGVRPTVPAPRFDAVPAALAARDQWVLWRFDQDDSGRWAKVPYRANGRGKASTKDPATWSGLDAARIALGGPRCPAGVGFVFAAGGGIVGVDIDDCRDPDSGEIAPWALALLEELGSYAEVSPTGTGVKVFLLGRKPGGRCRREYRDGEVEVYEAGRYFTFTGSWVTGTPAQLEERQAALQSVCGRVFCGEEKKGAGGRTRPPAPPAF